MTAPVVVGKALPERECYLSQKTMRSFWRRSSSPRYDFAIGSDAGGGIILPKHERESEPRYTRRKGQSMPRRYAGTIIERYNDHVCRTEAVRPKSTPTSEYGKLLADATGAGISLQSFMRSCLKSAEIDGVGYILVDSSDRENYSTLADEKASGKRPIFRKIDPDAVIWWREWNGLIVEAIIVMEAEDGRDFAWWVDKTNGAIINLKMVDKGYIVESVEPAQNLGYGGCPLVRLYPDFAGCELIGDSSQIAPLAECQKAILNLDSWLTEELQGATFTTQVFLGVSPAQLTDAIVGPGMALALPGVDGRTPSLGTLGADPAQAESLRKSIKDQIIELYRVSGLASGTPTEVAQPVSGISKAFEFNEIEVKLAALAESAEKAENRAVKLASNGFNFAYPGDAEWPDEFQTIDLAAELEFTIRTLTAPLPEIIKKVQVQRYAQNAYTLTPEQTNEMNTDLDQMAQDSAEAKLIAPGVTPGT